MARRSLRSVLLHIDLDPGETTIEAFISMLDHFYEYPHEYKEIIYGSI